MSEFESTHRGVWVAPWHGPNGALVVFSMDSHGRLIHGPEAIPAGMDPTKFSDRLWKELDHVDPVRRPLSVTAPRFQQTKPSDACARRPQLQLVT